jgi:hypothetical protein
MIMSLFRLSGDGLRDGQKVSPELMAMLKVKVEEYNRDYAGEKAGEYDNTRLCLWENQSVNGLRMGSDTEPAFPFEGAPDFRVRLADRIINETAMLWLLAAMRAQVSIAGPGRGIQRGKKLQALAEWLKSSLWGRKYARAILELAQYVNGDTPAIGLMKVEWRNVKRLVAEEITLDNAMEIFVTAFLAKFQEMQPDAVEAEAAEAAALAGGEFEAAIASEDPAVLEQMAVRLTEALPYVTMRRARRVMRDLKKFGKAMFPRPVTTFEGPDIEAAQFYRDFIFDKDAADFESLDLWFEPMWLTESSARKLAVEEGWSRAFQDALFGEDDGQHVDGANGKKGVADLQAGQDELMHEDHYQVVRARMQLANDDGIVGHYWLTFRSDIEEPATGLKLADWPGVLFEREVLGRQLLAGRGVTELVSGDQGILKVIVDGFGMNAILNGAPPILDYGRKDSGQIYIEPLLGIALRNANAKVEFMKGPEFPRQTPEMIRWIERNVDGYFGRPNADVPPATTDAMRQGQLIWFMAQLAEVWKQALVLCQNNMTPAMLDQVTGKNGAAVIQNKEDIEGPFTLTLHFNPEDLDLEKLKVKVELLKNVMPLDKMGSISLSEVVAHFMGALFPQFEFVKTEDQAGTDEVKDEQNVYMRILAGLEDERPTDGSLNYQARLQWLEGHMQANMEKIAALDDKTKLMLDDRREFLMAQAEQFGKNAEIGREGAERKAEDVPEEAAVNG